MTDGCPVWKNYRDTEEVCDVPIPDGSIYFLVGATEYTDVTTWGVSETCADAPECGETCPDDDDVDVDGEVYFNTDLPNPELGEWRYEFSGTFTPTSDAETIDDCFSIELIDEGGGVFSWDCRVILATDSALTSYTVPCGEECVSTGYDDYIPYFAINGIISIYYTLNEVEYGPITIDATYSKFQEVSCY